MKDLMIDIETLGTSGRFAVLQVGASFFDINTGEIGDKFLMNISMDEQLNDLNFTSKGETILWHIENDIENFKFCLSNYETVSDFCESFTLFINAGQYDRCWATATIDYQGIDNLFNSINLDNPIKYNARLCARTMRNLYKMRHSEYKYENKNSHNALDDCISQIDQLVYQYKQLC